MRGCVFRAWSAVWWFSELGSYGLGFTAAGWLCQCLRVPGVVGVAHSRALGVGGNRGIMRNSSVGSSHGHAPMCADPLTAHGNPTTTHYDHQKIPSFQQKTALTPQRPRPPMCNTNDNHTRSTHPPRLAPRSVHFRLEIGPIQLGRTDVETRTTSSRAKATCRTSEPPANSRPTEA